MICQEVMRRLALDRLHDAARRQVRWRTQQQMHMIRPNMTLQNLNVVTAANLSNQVPYLRPHVPPQHRLAILRDEHEVIMQTINRVGGSTILAHARQRIASLLKASPEGEGIHPSQSVTLRMRVSRCKVVSQPRCSAEPHVRTVSNNQAAAAPNRILGDQAASVGSIHPPLPSAPNRLSAVR